MLVDDEWRFVYSPRLGAAYKLDCKQIANDTLLRLLGLSPCKRVSRIEDPAISIGLRGAYEKDIPPAEVMRWAQHEPEARLRRLCRCYRLFHRHRHVFTPQNVHRWARFLAMPAKLQNLTVDRIGKLVAVTERRAGFSNCYPRALLTGGLCAMAGIRSNITIGILAPTRKLHAWCTSDGILIYEPTPRHWWHTPLVEFQFRPADGT